MTSAEVGSGISGVDVKFCHVTSPISQNDGAQNDDNDDDDDENDDDDDGDDDENDDDDDEDMLALETGLFHATT